jgi:hypothetical protein
MLGTQSSHIYGSWLTNLMISYGIWYGVDVHGGCALLMCMVGTWYGTCCT